MKKKCEFKNCIGIYPDGINELDPCVYEEIEKYKNVTVVISKCKNCGNIDISWVAQENTEKVDLDEEL